MVNEFQTPRGAAAMLRFRRANREKRILNHKSFQRDLRRFHRNL